MMGPRLRLGLLLAFIFAGTTAMQTSQQAGLHPSPQEIETIGLKLIDQAGSRDGIILLYADLDEGWTSYDLLYQAPGGQDVRQVLTGPGDTWDLAELLMETWDRAREQQGDQVWQSMVYVLDNGHVNIRLLYRGQFDPEADLHQRALAEFRNLDRRTPEAGSPPPPAE